MKVAVVFVALFVAALGREGFGPGEQEWGFVNVRKDANIFYWLYYTTANVDDVHWNPLIIWLQGGPGASGTGYGNFAELGPLDVNLEERNTTWVKNYNVMFVDNPVGTGFSYVENNAFAENNTQIAKDFLAFLKGFYEQNPLFKDTDLYIFCESYGGKMTAEIALVLDQAIKNGELDIPFKGVGLGDSWISPIDSTLTWAPYLLNLGVVDQAGYDKINEVALKAKQALDDGKYKESTNYWAETEMVVDDVTFGADFYNILKKISTVSKYKHIKGFFMPGTIVGDEDDEKIDVIMNGPVREALNITQSWGTQSNLVFEYLTEDFMKPVTHIVEELLNTTSLVVAVYNGQLDLIVDTPGTIKWVDELNWPESEQWKTTERHSFTVNHIVEGYVKVLDQLIFFWVDRAGHMVPADNPAGMNFLLNYVANHHC